MSRKHNQPSNTSSAANAAHAGEEQMPGAKECAAAPEVETTKDILPNDTKTALLKGESALPRVSIATVPADTAVRLKNATPGDQRDVPAKDGDRPTLDEVTVVGKDIMSAGENVTPNQGGAAADEEEPPRAETRKRHLQLKKKLLLMRKPEHTW